MHPIPLFLYHPYMSFFKLAGFFIYLSPLIFIYYYTRTDTEIVAIINSGYVV